MAGLKGDGCYLLARNLSGILELLTQKSSIFSVEWKVALLYPKIYLLTA